MICFGQKDPNGALSGIGRAIWDLSGLGLGEATAGCVILEGQFDDGDISTDGWYRSIDESDISIAWKKEGKSHGWCKFIRKSLADGKDVIEEGLYEQNMRKSDPSEVTYDLKESFAQ